MLADIKNWIRHLFNPHCEICEGHRHHCESCENLKQQLAVVNRQNEQLMDKILHPQSQEQTTQPAVAHKPVQTGAMPWRVKRAMLEEEDRARAAQNQREKLLDNTAKESMIKDGVMPELRITEDDLDAELESTRPS